MGIEELAAPEEGVAVRNMEGFWGERETVTTLGWGERTGGPGVGGRGRSCTCWGEDGGGPMAAGDLAYKSGPAGDLMARWDPLAAGEDGGGPAAGEEGTENWYWAAGEGAGEWLGGR